MQLKTRLASLLMETGVSYDMSRSCWPVRMSLRADGKYETTFDYQLPMSGPQKVTFEILPPSGSCHLLLSRRLDEPFSNIAHCDQLNDYMDVVIP